MSKIPAVIFDIDGTLADCEHRRHFLAQEPKDWTAFLKAMGDDPVKTTVADIASYYHSICGHEILLCTGRGEEYRPITEQWLTWNMIRYTHLFMRPLADHRDDATIKAEIYTWKIEPFYDVRLVVDDRTSVVNMWRGMGLECWQVAPGDF